MTDVTRILSQIEQGDPASAERLLPLVYEELRKLAAAKLATEKPVQTLQPLFLPGHKGEVASLVISPNSRWLVSGGGEVDMTARLWDRSFRVVLFVVLTEAETNRIKYKVRPI